MPAVSVLPLGSSTVTAPLSYSDIASKQVVGAANSPQAASNNNHNNEGMNKPGMDSSREVSAPGPEEEASKVSHDNKAAGPEANSTPEKGGNEKTVSATKNDNSTTGTTSPSQSSTGIPQSVQAHGTPQPSGYYVAYGNNTQVTPEPPSPHTTGPTVYDVGYFLQQGAGFHSAFPAIPSHPYAAAASGQPQPPNSPSASIPPASPLFPRVTNPSTAAALLSASRGELSPGPPYVSSGGSTDDFAWGDSR